MNVDGFYPMINFKDLIITTMIRKNKREISFEDLKKTKNSVERRLKRENTLGKVMFGSDELTKFMHEYSDIFTVSDKTIKLNKEYNREFLIEHFLSFLPIKTLYWLGFIKNEGITC